MLKQSLRYIDKVAAGFIAITGAYLTWYWYGAISERESLGNIVSNVENWQNSVSLWLQSQGATRLALVCALVTGVALVIVGLSRTKQMLRRSRR